MSDRGKGWIVVFAGAAAFWTIAFTGAALVWEAFCG